MGVHLMWPHITKERSLAMRIRLKDGTEVTLKHYRYLGRHVTILIYLQNNVPDQPIELVLTGVHLKAVRQFVRVSDLNLTDTLTLKLLNP
jgi:hypothetical protein